MVDSWRQVARGQRLANTTSVLDSGYGRLSQVQCMTLLKDASDIARGLVGLDRRYANIPGWQSLKDAGWLGRAASRDELTAALVHRPEPRTAQPGLSV